MTFKTGQSGNRNGRPKGSPNRRTQLAKLLEPHAEALVGKLIELALQGDVHAIRLCIDRLIPKTRREATGIEFHENPLKLKEEILRAALEGRISAQDAEKLSSLINLQPSQTTSLNINTTDPVEASRIYQQIMMS